MMKRKKMVRKRKRKMKKMIVELIKLINNIDYISE
jgi:hypothetical protein